MPTTKGQVKRSRGSYLRTRIVAETLHMIFQHFYEQILGEASRSLEFQMFHINAISNEAAQIQCTKRNTSNTNENFKQFYR